MKFKNKLEPLTVYVVCTAWLLCHSCSMNGPLSGSLRFLGSMEVAQTVVKGTDPSPVSTEVIHSTIGVHR